MNSVTVRWMRADEQGAVRSLGRRAFSPFLGIMMSLTLSPHVLVAEDEDGRLVGGLDLKTFRVAGQKLGVVRWIFTAPERQGTGIGKALLEAALEWFRQEKCNQVVTTGVDGYNSRSWNLFEGRGFRHWRFLEQVREMGWGWPLMIAGTFHFCDVGSFLLRKRLDGAAVSEEKPSRGLGALVVTTLVLCLLLAICLRPLSPAALLASAAVVTAYVVARTAGHVIAAWALRIPLVFRPWESGLMLATFLALAFGVFFPCGGSFYVRRPRFRYTEARPTMGRIALGGVVPSLALLVAFTILSGQGELARLGREVGILFGFFDTLPFFSPFDPLPARHLWRWNRATWLVVTLCFLAVWFVLPRVI